MSDVRNSSESLAMEGGAPLPEEGTPENPSRRVLTLANVITITRLILTFVFLYMFPLDINRRAAVAIYIIAALTDWLDGNIARATKTVSWFGKLVDPIVDRALIFTGVLALVLHGDVPLWIAVVLAIRDVWLFIGVEYLKTFTPKPMDVIFIGKVATALLMIGFSLLLIGTPDLPALGIVDVPFLPLLNDSPAGFGMPFVYVGTVLSVITACVYWHKGFQVRDAIVAARDSGQGSDQG